MPIYNRYKQERLYLFGEPVEPPEYREGNYLGQGAYANKQDCEDDVSGADKIGIKWSEVDGFICDENEDGSFDKYIKLQKFYKNDEPYIPEEIKKGNLIMNNLNYGSLECCQTTDLLPLPLNSFWFDVAELPISATPYVYIYYTINNNVNYYSTRLRLHPNYHIYFCQYTSTITSLKGFIKDTKNIIRVCLDGLTLGDEVDYEEMFSGTDLIEINFGMGINLVNPVSTYMMLNCENLKKIKASPATINYFKNNWGIVSSYPMDDIEFVELDCENIPASITPYSYSYTYMGDITSSTASRGMQVGLNGDVSSGPISDVNYKNYLTEGYYNQKQTGTYLIPTDYINSLYDFSYRISNVYEYDLSNLIIRNPYYRAFEWAFYSNTDVNRIIMPSVLFDYDCSFSFNNAFEYCSNLEYVDFNRKGYTSSRAKISSAEWMFYGCTNLRNIDLTELQFKGTTSFKNMFNNCSKLTDIKLKCDVKLSSPTEIGGLAAMFSRCTNLQRIDIEGLEIGYRGDGTDIGSMQVFSGCDNLRYIRCNQSFYNFCCKYGTSKLALPEAMRCDGSGTGVWDIAIVDVKEETWEELEGQYYCEPFDASFGNSFVYSSASQGSWSYIINNSSIGYEREAKDNVVVVLPDTISGITSLKKFVAGSSSSVFAPYIGNMYVNFDLTANTSCESSFQYNGRLEKIEFMRWNDDWLNNTTSMFDYCESLKDIVIDNFKGEKVANIDYMFRNCKSLPSDVVNNMLKNFKGDLPTQASQMFTYCSSFTDLKLPNFVGNKITYMNRMFQYCSATSISLPLLQGDSSSLNTQYMFGGCTNLEYLDISSLNVPTSYTSMFQNCNNLKKIKCKREFMEFCLNRASSINLPDILKTGSTENWEIIN